MILAMRIVCIPFLFGLLVSASSDESFRPPPPYPPQQVPLRFLIAENNNSEAAHRRYHDTLKWRKTERIDDILREPFEDFFTIKQHYPHFFHMFGFNGEPVYYELVAKIDLKTLIKKGVGYEKLLRHYTMITEFQWQVLSRDDYMTSIFVVDLEGAKLGDFVGKSVDFIKKASALSAMHYPERAGKIFLVNVPRWFHIIWKVVKPLVPENTLHKIFILRGKDEILFQLQQYIPLQNIPREYGGTGTNLGDSPEEKELAQLMEHNLQLARQKRNTCPGCSPHLDVNEWPCRFCSWQLARSY